MSITGIDGDERGEGVVVAALQFADPGSGRGMDDGRAHGVAGAHEVSPLCMGSLGGVHGANEGDLIGLLGKVFETLTELDAIDIGRECFDWPSDLAGCVWFWVESIQVSHPTRHEKIDDAFGFSSSFCQADWIGGECFGAEKVERGSANGDTETGLRRARHEVTTV